MYRTLLPPPTRTPQSSQVRFGEPRRWSPFLSEEGYRAVSLPFAQGRLSHFTFLIPNLLLLSNINSLHSHRDAGAVAWADGNRGDLVNHVHAGNNLAECRVLTVEVRRVLVHNEEL